MFGSDGIGDPQEDLTYNPFFKTLTKNYAALYAQAEKNCWVICVPKTSACQGLKMTKADMGTNYFYSP
jgi:hypothetical protein